MLNYLVILYRCREKVQVKMKRFSSSSSIILEHVVHLNADHKYTPDAHVSDIRSLIMSCRSSISYARYPYSGKLIAE